MLVIAFAVAAGLRLDVPVTLTAQAPASAQETSLVPWVGPRLGYFVDDLSYAGVEGQLLVGLDTQGTNEVAVTRFPVVVEARGVYGAVANFGLVDVAGYGYGGVGVGGGAAVFSAFDESRVRGFGLWVVRGGAGVELAFLRATTRIEVGAGVRDLRLELSGSFSVGGRF